MTHTILGKQVGPIGYGMMQLAFNPNMPQEQAFTCIKAALDSGCTYLNGSQYYGNPTKNSLTLLRGYFDTHPQDADKVLLNIKGCMGLDRIPNGSKDFTHQSIETCLEQLGPVGRIDQFGPARKDPRFSYEDDTLATINAYVQDGTIRGISCSELNAMSLRQVSQKFKITSLEIELSMFTTEPITNGLLTACADLDIPVLAYSPLGRGLLGGKLKLPEDLAANDPRTVIPRYQGENLVTNLKLVTKIDALARRKGCTQAQIAINWLLYLSKRPGMPAIIPIPGSSNPERIKENATIIELSAEDLAEIDEILEDFTVAGERYPKQQMAHVDA